MFLKVMHHIQPCINLHIHLRLGPLDTVKLSIQCYCNSASYIHYYIHIILQVRYGQYVIRKGTQLYQTGTTSPAPSTQSNTPANGLLPPISGILICEYYLLLFTMQLDVSGVTRHKSATIFMLPFF